MNTDISDVRITSLPPRTTTLHQLLELGLIGAYKVRYRSFLLRFVISIKESKFSGNVEFRSDFQRGKYGMSDGQPPLIADAMDIFSKAWSTTRKYALIKCWLKRSCLPESHCTQSGEYLESTERFIHTAIKNFSGNVVDESTSMHIFNDMRGTASADYSLLNALVA